MALGKLDIIIAGDTAQLRKDMSTAVGIMQSSAKTMENVAKTAGAALGGYFAFDMFKSQVQQTLDFADNLSKLSQKTGISTDALYSLNAAAKLSDVEFEALSGSLAKFNKNIGSASTGTGDAKKAFDSLGISVKNQDGTLKNSFEILGELADQFKDMPDGATKASTAMALFGKSGAELIPLLNGGRDSLREYLGVMDNETGKAAERFNDSITKISLSTKSGLVEVMKQALPFMESVSTEFENMAAKGSFLSHNAEYIAGSFDILSATMQGSKEIFSSVSDTVGAIVDTFHGIADSITGYDASLKEANDTTEKTLTFFQFLAVDVKTASLAVTIVSNTVKAAINDFMNLGFEAEKSFLKMKSFVGAGSKENDYRIAQLSSFIANRNMDSANLALKEAEIAKSIMDYQAKSSAQNWARENNVLGAFDTISKTEFKGVSDTQKIIDTYNSLDKAKDEAIKKAGGDVDKIAAINAKYQATAKKLNDSFATTSDEGIGNENAIKSYNATLSAQIAGLEKQYDIKKQIENLNIESSLRNEAISKPEAERLKEINEISSQIAKNQETINLLKTKKYESGSTDEASDLQKINDLQREQELLIKKKTATEERYTATIKAGNAELQSSIASLNMSDTDKQYQDLAKNVANLIKEGKDLKLVGEYATIVADQISRNDAYTHLQTELDIRSQIAEVSLYGAEKEQALEQIRHDGVIANLNRELETKKLNADEYLKLLAIENQRHAQNSDSFYKFMLDAFNNIEKAMDENFFNAMTGKFKSFAEWLKDLFKNIGTSIAQGLSRTIAGSLTQSLEGGIINMFKTYGGSGAATTAASLVGTTVSASDVGELMNNGGTYDSAANTITTAGGTAVKLAEDGSGTVTSSGSDILSIASTISSIKTAYDVMTVGITGSIISGFQTASGMLATLGAESAATGLMSFGVGVANPFAYASVSGLPTAMTIGSGLSAGLIGAGAGYGVGWLGDKLFGADTYAGTTGAIGGALGGIGASLGLWGGPVGILVGSVLGSVLGGIFGKTKVTGSGIDILGNATADSASGQYWTSYKKKSWFSSKSWTNYTPFSDEEIEAIKSTIGVYDYLLAQLGEYNDLVVSGGRFSNLQSFLDTNVVQAFLVSINPNNLSTIYQSWVDYAAEIDKTITEALATAVSGYTTYKRGYTEWFLGSGTVEQLAFTSNYLQKDFEALASSLGASSVTVDNFLSMYDAAIKNNFTQDTIEAWASLGDALMKSTDATKKYKDALDSLNGSTTYSLPVDTMLTKVNNTSQQIDLKQLVTTQTGQNDTVINLLVQSVKTLQSILKEAQFGKAIV